MIGNIFMENSTKKLFVLIAFVSKDTTTEIIKHGDDIYLANDILLLSRENVLFNEFDIYSQVFINTVTNAKDTKDNINFKDNIVLTIEQKHKLIELFKIIRKNKVILNDHTKMLKETTIEILNRDYKKISSGCIIPNNHDDDQTYLHFKHNCAQAKFGMFDI